MYRYGPSKSYRGDRAGNWEETLQWIGLAVATLSAGVHLAAQIRDFLRPRPEDFLGQIEGVRRALQTIQASHARVDKRTVAQVDQVISDLDGHYRALPPVDPISAASVENLYDQFRGSVVSLRKTPRPEDYAATYPQGHWHAGYASNPYPTSSYAPPPPAQDGGYRGYAMAPHEDRGSEERSSSRRARSPPPLPLARSRDSESRSSISRASRRVA